MDVGRNTSLRNRGSGIDRKITVITNGKGKHIYVGLS